MVLRCDHHVLLRSLPARAQMLKLAAALNRTLLVPDVPCFSAWIPRGERESATVQVNGDLVSVGKLVAMCYAGLALIANQVAALPACAQLHVPKFSPGGPVLVFPRRGGGVGVAPPDHLYCMWARSGVHEANPCTAHAISYPELSHFLDPVLPPDQRAPTEHNTLFHAEWAAAKVRVVCASTCQLLASHVCTLTLSPACARPCAGGSRHDAQAHSERRPRGLVAV